MSVGLVSVLFVAAGMIAVGAFAAAWRRDATAALAGIPLMFGGAGIAFAGVARFAARATAATPSPTTQIVVSVSGPPLGQAAAVLIAIAALALVALGVGLAARAARMPAARQEASR
jgi:hypothetical protein